MQGLELVIGDKRYSSWSLRPWLVMKAAAIPFSEARIRLRQPDTARQCLAHSPSGKVPLLKHGNLRVWDSLAICEYLADRFPDKRLWPKNGALRAEARSIAAEMHSGFMDMRRELPMDCAQALPLPEMSNGALRDVERVQTIWRTCLARDDRGGPFLYGHFTIADGLYAPVVSRFITYGVALTADLAAYCGAVMALPAMQQWIAAAKHEL